MDYIKVINESSKQLTKIIDDIIDISKIEAGQMTIYPIPVNLNQLMNEMLMFFETYLHSAGKEHIKLILDDSAFIDQRLVYVDTIRLRQVFNNLIGNAVKFTEKGYIRFGYRQSAPDQLEFFVEDSGIGLPLDQQKIIFERFRQAETDNNRLYRGAGLGLAISQSLVQMMGGKIWVESTEGSGASFYFTISYLSVAPEDVHIFVEAPDDSKIPKFKDSRIKSMNQEKLNQFCGKSVLVVAAHLCFKYYEKLISATGATVTQFESLQNLVAQTKLFDVVIVHASQLDKEDFDNMQHIKDIRPNLPIVFIIADKKGKYPSKLCNATVEIPVDYGKILKIMEKYFTISYQPHE
jgi:hypothetical protein